MTEPVDESAGSGARVLARRAMTAQIAEMAVELFLERGFETTTVDDICAVAGISRSSFFRYFGSKEDVLAREDETIVDEVLPALAGRPDAEPAWVALRRALDPVLARYLAEPERSLRWARLVRETPSLASFRQERIVRKARPLRPEIARRIAADPDDGGDPRTDALIGAAFACLEAGTVAWVATGGAADLAELIDRAMGVLA